MNKHVAHVPELSDALPKWLQVSAALEAEIERRIAAGDLRLPTEAELCETYSVSLVTVRQALSALENRGLISRKRKRGTHILPDGVMKRSALSIGTIDDALAAHGGNRAELMFAEVVAIPNELRPLFPGQVNVMKLILRRFNDDEPASYEVDHVRLDIAAQIDLGRLTETGLLKLLRDQGGTNLGSIHQKFMAKPASPEIAGELGIELLSPVLALNLRCYDDEQRLVGVQRITYRGDKFDFNLVVTDSRFA